MHGWMTSRHEGCVSTMLTDKRLEYCTAGAPLQGSGATKWMMQADKHGISGVFRLDNAGPARPIASPAAWSHIPARGIRSIHVRYLDPSHKVCHAALDVIEQRRQHINQKRGREPISNGNSGAGIGQ